MLCAFSYIIIIFIFLLQIIWCAGLRVFCPLRVQWGWHCMIWPNHKITRLLYLHFVPLLSTRWFVATELASFYRRRRRGRWLLCCMQMDANISLFNAKKTHTTE